MASRGGPMISGTDGADFEHRQRVAAHYQIRCESNKLKENAKSSAEFMRKKIHSISNLKAKAAK